MTVVLFRDVMSLTLALWHQQVSRLEMMTLRQFAITVVIFLPDHENIYQQSIPPVAVETRDKCSLSGFKFKVSCRNKEYPWL